MQIINIQRFIDTDKVIDIELLSSMIIKSMLANEDMILRTDEGFSYEENGLYNILDNLCAVWNFDKSRITLETNNWLEAHDKYKIKYAPYSSDVKSFDSPHKLTQWNKEKLYGLFVGRGRLERIQSIIKHRAFKYRDQGLTSFHHNFDDFPVDANIARLSRHTKLTVDDILSIRPYSDIDQLRSVPIVAPMNMLDSIWSGVYEKIAVEIVCETNQWPSSFQLTEKTLRPMYYQRPFLIVGSKDYLKKLKHIGFRTFDGLIPTDYDELQGFYRVDRIFDILKDIIENNQMDGILQACHYDLTHNYNLLLELGKKHKAIYASDTNYFNEGTLTYDN